jgi:hypothetical protein
MQAAFIHTLRFQKSLAENVRAFETSKEVEKKKLDEERKWVRREKSLFEKTVKDKKNSFERRAQDEVEELQNKVFCSCLGPEQEFLWFRTRFSWQNLHKISCSIIGRSDSKNVALCFMGP